MAFIDTEKIPYYLDTSEDAPMEGRMIAFKSDIDKIPTADVVEVKHGYWYEIDSDVGWELVGCSICRGEYSLSDGEDRTNYCPYCGAKMDGRSDTE